MNMTYGSRQYKNGGVAGYLTFSTGKKIYLNKQENIEFMNKINYWLEVDKMKKEELIKKYGWKP